MNYFGRFNPSAMKNTLQCIGLTNGKCVSIKVFADTGRGLKIALVYQETRAEAVCSLEQEVFVLLNDKSCMKGSLHVRFREKLEVKVLLFTQLRGRRLITPAYSI